MDPKLVFFLLIFATVFSFGQAVWGLVGARQQRRTVNKRLAIVERTSSLGELVGELRKQRGLTEDGRSVFSWGWLADLVIRSGVTVDPQRWALVLAGLVMGGGLAGLFFTHNAVVAIGGALVAGIGLPLVYLTFQAGSRAKKLSLQLPQALEVMVRSLEAGHPIPTSISLVGRELPDPVGSEFGMAADEIAYGATLEQAVARIADRCRHPDVDLFAAAIRLQEKSGGNLTSLLKMLAKTVRERHKMRLKIRAASSEGRMSAYILTAAPVVCFIFINVAQPHYYSDVINARWVQVGLAILGGLLVTGNLIMRRMIDMKDLTAVDPNNLITYAGLGAIALGVAGVSFMGLRTFATTTRRRARLAGGPVGPVADAGGGVSGPLSGVVGGVRRIGDRIAIQDPSQLTALRAKLVQAGYYSREAAAIYLGARAAAMVVAILGMVMILPWALSKHGGIGALALGGAFAIASIMGPDYVVNGRRKKREIEYMEGFPDLLDLLVASVEAGLSLDAAVSRVTDELQRRYPSLADHLRVLTLELRAGRSRKDAWTAFAERLGIDEARSLATMLRQAEEMGTSLGETLAVFSEDMRAKRMLKAEEKAMALPAKMMIPLILFIFPCLIGVLMLPAAYKIKETLMK